MNKYLLRSQLCILLLAAVVMPCYAQSKHRSVTTHTKLVKTLGKGIYDVVCCGLQDKMGNLWFGTSAEGVYRYDGRTFVNFTTKDGLSSNAVRSVIEDRSGNIWFCTSAGVCSYNPATAQLTGEPAFTHIPINTANTNFFLADAVPNSDPAANVTPSVLLQDSKGKIWLGTSNGVYCYNGVSFGRVLHKDVINKNNIKLMAVQSIMEDRNGNIWFTTWFEGLCRYDGKSLVNFKPNGEVWFAGICQDHNGSIWVGRRSNGVCRYDSKPGQDGVFTNLVQHGVFDSCCIYTIKEDKAGNLWFAAEADDMTKRDIQGGLWRYDGKTFTNFTTKDGLSNNTVFNITIDTSGKLWIGTRNTGLCTYDGKRCVDLTGNSSKPAKP